MYQQNYKNSNEKYMEMFQTFYKSLSKQLSV